MKILAGLRVTAGLTQTKVANAVGLTQTAISAWERGDGNPSFDKIPVLADLYNVTEQVIIDAIMNKPHEVIISGKENLNNGGS